ncbi:MAG: hypothetical protein CL563_08630 [Alphaproteobacteria bacterium]|nr:hypothetical protein [Alphaproteobacteria bacterium]
MFPVENGVKNEKIVALNFEFLIRRTKALCIIRYFFYTTRIRSDIQQHKLNSGILADYALFALSLTWQVQNFIHRASFSTSENRRKP